MVDAFIAIVVIVGLWLYSRWLKRGIAPCTFETVLPRDRIRAIFRGSVTGVAWNIVQDDDSDDDSMVARGGLSDWLTVIPVIGYLIGGKQEIALHMSEEDEESNKLQVVVGAHLFIRKNSAGQGPHAASAYQ